MASTESTKISKEFEAQTNRVLSFETNPTPENISKCNQQLQSPLFKILPAEIRNDIFSLALLQYEDLANPYPEHDFCYRPGHRARRIVSTDLLLTCRRIWLEANHWPMEQAVHSFWYDRSRRPTWTVSTGNATYSDDFRFLEFMNGLTPLQKPRVKHIQVSAQMYWLDETLNTGCLWTQIGRQSLTLSTFTITIRHSDWWHWEAEVTLRLNAGWVSELLQSSEANRVSEFPLELETLEWRIDQLRPIFESLKSATEPRENDTIRWELLEPFEEISWSGPTDLGGKDRAIYSERNKLDYRITTMRWKRCEDAAKKIEQWWHEEGSLLKLLGDTAIPDKSEDCSRWQTGYGLYSEEDSDDEDSDDDDDDDEDQ
jgi:hypothetical protein